MSTVVNFWATGREPDPDCHGLRLLDPFAGVGRIHELRNAWLETVGVEIEAEWANQSPYTIVGDSRKLPFPDNHFSFIATSPTYGNRMADHHEAKDSCRRCEGSGRHKGRPCNVCRGKGVSRRFSYFHMLGRDLSPGNTGAFRWGPQYRSLHVDVFRECRRVLRDDGLFIINVSDHVAKGEVVPVISWFVGLMYRLGFTVMQEIQIETPRMRFGKHHEARVAYESVLVFRRLQKGSM